MEKQNGYDCKYNLFTSIFDIIAEQKQAKIDMLKELSEQAMYCDQWNCKVVPIEYIDELIKEVKNDNSKSN